MKFNFEHTFEAYERWRHSLENDIMWRQMAGEKNRWNVNGKLIFDSNGHAINHCGYDLLKAVLEKMDLSSIEPNGQIEDTVFPEDKEYGTYYLKEVKTLPGYVL